MGIYDEYGDSYGATAWDASPGAWGEVPDSYGPPDPLSLEPPSLSRPEDVAKADPYDLTPKAPWVRGRSEIQAKFDVARVSTRAAMENPKVKPIAAWWTQQALATPYKSVTEQVVSNLPWWFSAPTMAVRKRMILTDPGKVVLFDKNEKRIADAMAKVYQQGADALRGAGSPEWADVLASARSGAEGVKERVDDISLKSGAEDAIERGKTALKIGTPILVVLAVAAGIVYLKYLK